MHHIKLVHPVGPRRLGRTWISAKTRFLRSQLDCIQMSSMLLLSRLISISRSLFRRMSLQLSLPGPIWRHMQTLLRLTRIQKHHVAEINSNRFILISLNFTTDVKQHHKTSDHETHQRTTGRGWTEGWRPIRLVSREKDFFPTYLVWWDVHVDVTEAAVGGETVLANLNGPRRRNQTVDTGGVPLSENAEQLTAVDAYLLVSR